MKKLITATILLALVISGFAQLRPVVGFYFLITKDSVNFPNVTLYPDNGTAKKRPLFITIDSISHFKNNKLLWDQTGKFTVFFNVYQNYRSYRTWLLPIQYSVNFIDITYDDFDIQGSGTGLEGYIPTAIKGKLMILFDVPSNKITYGSIYE